MIPVGWFRCKRHRCCLVPSDPEDERTRQERRERERDWNENESWRGRRGKYNPRNQHLSTHSNNHHRIFSPRLASFVLPLPLLLHPHHFPKNPFPRKNPRQRQGRTKSESKEESRIKFYSIPHSLSLHLLQSNLELRRGDLFSGWIQAIE